MITSLMGCGVVYFNPRNMDSLNLGMTRTEVITILGRPNIAEEEEWGEHLEYFYGGTQYFIKLKDGKVESYGTVD